LNHKRNVLTFGTIVTVAIVAGYFSQKTSWAAQPQQSQGTSAAEKVIASSDCQACHALDRKLVGPSYIDVAKKYVGQADAPDKLIKSIREGASGTWGDIKMVPHPMLKDDELKEVVTWILAQKDQTPEKTGAPAKQYPVTLKDGTTRNLDFPLFVEGQAPKVTKDVFRGYLMYNSYCFRCHGQDATESELAPDLKDSVGKGMTIQQYLATAMAGRPEKGMPTWAGFLTEDEIRGTYEYVVGRMLNLIPTGRPPSE
jgi:cytochrome c